MPVRCRSEAPGESHATCLAESSWPKLFWWKTRLSFSLKLYISIVLFEKIPFTSIRRIYMKSSWKIALVLFVLLMPAFAFVSQATSQAWTHSEPSVQNIPDPANAAVKDFAQLGRYRDANEVILKDAKNPVHVVFLGDSILERWGHDAGVWFDNSSWINRGVSGQTTSQILLRERSDVLALHPHAVVLEGGSNDMRLGFTPEAIRDNFATMGDLAEAHHIRVFITTMTPVCDCVQPLTGLRTVNRIKQLNGLLKSLSREHHWTLIDINPSLADVDGLMRADFTSDGVHPNDEGYKPLAEIFVHALKKFW
jgi:lysophospholipase L1-like esterase